MIGQSIYNSPSAMKESASAIKSSVFKFKQSDNVPETTEEYSDSDEEITVGSSSETMMEEQPQPSPIARRPSLKLSSLQEEIPVKTTKGSWKQLPKPNMKEIRRSISLPTYIADASTSSSEASDCKPKDSSPQVSFQNITIREYDQTLGDSPSCSYGPPIQLDWKYVELLPIQIDDYEANRPERRNLRQMGLNYYHRCNILSMFSGHSEEEINQAEKDANRGKFRRAITRALLPLQPVEEIAQSASRKTKRYLQRRRSATV
jgi:hypothetical protein